jgi:ATP-dependent DNA helicase DinG
VPPSTAALITRAADALRAATEKLPAGEERPGQAAMAEAVARAIADRRHLVVAAGTGTGKSLAYLVPAVLSGRRVVVATATKALQDQLCGMDLPFLHEHLEQPFTHALLKGRSNYLCLQRVAEVEAAGTAGQGSLRLDTMAERAPADELRRIVEWGEATHTGDRAELDFEPSPSAWGALSVNAIECPGATKCPKGEECFAERARWAAAAADVVVVNMHLYGMHLASGGVVLPDHDVLVLDEAHQTEYVISDTCGIQLGPGRLVALGRSTRAVLDDDRLLADLETQGGRLRDALGRELGRRIRRMAGEDLAAVLVDVRQQVDAVVAGLRKVPDDVSGDVTTRKQRAMAAATHLVDDIDTALEQAGPDVVWVEGTADSPVLRVAPVEVGEVLRAALWGDDKGGSSAGSIAGDGDEGREGGREGDGDREDHGDGSYDGADDTRDDHTGDGPGGVTVVLTSATVPPGLAPRLGLAEGRFDELDVGSPFDYEHNAVLYCAAHLPEPRSAGFDEATHQELEALIGAAGGRTLALFTSWRAMDAAAEALADRLPGRLLTQRELPKPALVKAFTDDPRASLFATLGFWQGIDVPGPTLSLVTIDKLPFPRPDEPLLSARREVARAAAFTTVDLPRAATMLAQGAGRLIRTATDRGVVAVLDRRLSTAGYRWNLVGALPPMRRTKDRDEVVAWLRTLDAEASEREDLAASAPP